MHVTFTWGHSQGQNSGSGHNPNPLSTFWALGGGGGGSQDGVPGTPTYIPQKDPLVPLIILNTHLWGFSKKNSPMRGPGPSSHGGGGGGGGVEVRKILLPSARQLEEGRETRLETSKCH